jgi:transposase
MSGFVEGIDRSQSTLFPALLDDYVAEDNLVRAVDAFVEGLDLGKLGFSRVEPLEQGRPGYHPATLLKIYIYGYPIAFRRAAALSANASATSSWSG